MSALFRLAVHQTQLPPWPALPREVKRPAPAPKKVKPAPTRKRDGDKSRATVLAAIDADGSITVRTLVERHGMTTGSARAAVNILKAEGAIRPRKCERGFDYVRVTA